MNYSKFRFTLDMQSALSQISLPVTLGDTSRTLYISLCDSGAPYFIADGCLAMLSIRRPTGTFMQAFCAIEDNAVIRYDFSENKNTAAVEGVHDCQIVLYDADGDEVATPRFTMVVNSRVVNKDDLNISDEDQSAIQNMIAAEAARAAAEEARVKAESERAAAFDKMMGGGGGGFATQATLTTVNLPASAWITVEELLHSQVVAMSGITAKSKVDLQPSVEQLTIFHEKDIAFVTENDEGVITVFAIGDKPTNDYTIQATITEVSV